MCKKLCLVVLSRTVVPTPFQLHKVAAQSDPRALLKCDSRLAVVPDKGREFFIADFCSRDTGGFPKMNL